MPDVTEPDDFARRFGQLIERYVISLGWTHEEVAHAVWRDSARKSHVTAYIKGTKGKPSNPTIAKFVKALGISEADLEACRVPPAPAPSRSDEGSGLGGELIAELARQFDVSAEAQGVLGWSDFLREKAAEHRSLKDEIRELRGTNPRLDNQLAEAEHLMERGRFRAAGEILRGAKEIAREVVREPLEQLSRLEQAQGRLAVLEGDHERGATHLINAARLFDGIDPDHAIALRQKLGQQTELRSRRYGGVGAAAAVRIFRSIEEIASEAERPADWANAMNSAGIALRNQGARTGGEAGAALLGEAVAAYRAALRVCTEDAHPVDWAMTQNNLGTALSDQGARMGGEAGSALLGEAVAAYRAALRARTEDDYPVQWATTQNNLGVAFSDQGARTGGKAGATLLGEAVAAYRAALRVRTEDDYRVQWAMTQNNLGAALRNQGARTGGEAGAALLGEAVAAYRAALRVYTEDAHPVDWAMTQNNLGIALRNQGERMGGEAGSALLGEAVAAFRAALRVRTEDEQPVQWAETTHNIGAVFDSMAELKTEAARAHLEAALREFEAALRVFEPEHMPYHHRTTTEARDRVLGKLAGLG
ncbi:MAG: hypothetical protein AAF844_10220 [Pseudomonadota bacterium]